LNGRIPAVFESLGAKDTSKTTTQLTLVFNRDIEGLSADDITVDAGTTGAKKGGLAKAGLGTYSLALDGVTAVGTIAVSVARDGYLVSPSTQKAQAFFVNPVIAVDFLEVKANGEPNTESTTALTLKFSQAIEGLSAGDIAVEGAGFTKGALSPAGAPGVYTLALNEVTAQSEITVSAGKDGYKISDPSHEVTVSYPLRLTSVEANGVENEQSTTQLTLTFDRAIDGLDANDIKVSGSVGTVKNGALAQSELTYTLPVSGFTGSGTAIVTVQKDGYAQVNTQVPVVYYRAPGTPVPNVASITSGSIKEKFGVGGSGTAAVVTATFNELFAFIKNNGLTNTATNDVVQLGDWIDLEGGLHVDADTSKTAASQAPAITITNSGTVQTNNAPLLRLIVVGINSFNNINSNGTKQHVVFQFQNIPVKGVMINNDVKTDAGGYKGSHMQTYLTTKFLPGLNKAGVPEGVLWTPARMLSKGINGSGAEEVKDKLWLPTIWEMWGEQKKSSDGETSSNQARLTYYDASNPSRRNKYPSGSGLEQWYWTSSRSGTSATYFCLASGGAAVVQSASYDGKTNFGNGIAPAFCVGPGN
ncbi:MAG: DUF6273 domain-containing protein, partial [Spirochaetaceae bacterium]|nr:DUF6273 domain-containing protein [Spirochaetaceae bacterium]